MMRNSISAADVLAHGKTSRLYRQLVYERRIATDVFAYQHSREMSGVFQIACTAAAGVALPVLEQAVTDAVRELAAEGPTADELARARGPDGGAVRLSPADRRAASAASPIS